MIPGVRKPLTRRMRVVMLCVWTFVVASGVCELITHPQRITGVHGFMTGLGIAVGCMWIVKTIKVLIEEPQ
jgi:hypothetical protein